MHSYPLLILGMLLGAIAGWLYGYIGIGLMEREERAREQPGRAKPPGLLDYLIGWLAPVLLGFAGFILGWIGYSGVPTEGGAQAGSLGTALTNKGLALVLVMEIVGLSAGRLPAVLGRK